MLLKLFKILTIALTALAGISMFLYASTGADMLPESCYKIENNQVIDTPSNPKCISDKKIPKELPALYPMISTDNVWLVLGPLITVMIEVPIVMAFIRQYTLKKIIIVTVLNIATNLALVITTQLLFNDRYVPLGNIQFYQTFFELSIFLVEGVLINWLLNIKTSKAFLISFVANLASILIGLLITNNLTI